MLNLQITTAALSSPFLLLVNILPRQWWPRRNCPTHTYAYSLIQEPMHSEHELANWTARPPLYPISATPILFRDLGHVRLPLRALYDAKEISERLFLFLSKYGIHSPRDVCFEFRFQPLVLTSESDRLWIRCHFQNLDVGRMCGVCVCVCVWRHSCRRSSECFSHPSANF